MMMSNLKVSFEHDGQVARLTLAAPKANLVDQAMMKALAAAFDDLKNRPQLKVMILDAEGPHFSFGASVQEHLPEHDPNDVATVQPITRANAGTARGHDRGGPRAVPRRRI